MPRFNANWFLRRILIGPILKMFFKVRVIGLENLPERGGYIIAAGPHTTELESALLAVYLPKRQINFFAKAEYWEKPLGALFMNATGQIALPRTDARAADEAINIGARHLRRRRILGLYPEGTRSKDGKLHKGHTGVARTAFRAGGVPIVPVGMIGMHKLNPPGKGLRAGRATIVIEKPIYPMRHKPHDKQNLVDKALEAAVSRVVTDQLMREIAALSGADYVNTYSKIPGDTR